MAHILGMTNLTIIQSFLKKLGTKIYIKESNKMGKKGILPHLILMFPADLRIPCIRKKPLTTVLKKKFTEHLFR